jgi:ribosomal protein S18 acetylase RimI-like enzyme
MQDPMFESLRSFWLAFAGATRGGSTLELPGVWAAIVPAMPDRSVVNCVVYEDPMRLDAALGDLAAAYDEAGVSAWTVWVDSLDERAQSLLGAAGHAFDGDPMGQQIELESVERPGDGELDLIEAPTPADLDPVITAAYGWAGFGAALPAFPAGFHPYLARREGEPACCLGIWDWQGDAHVQMVGTSPEARGRGLASRLLRLALADARDRGCTVSRLQATAAGAPVYRRIGYRDLRPVQMWERRKPASAG